MKKTGLLVILGFLLSPFLCLAQPGFFVYPEVLEMPLNHKQVKSFVITNDGTQNLRLSVSAIHLNIGQKGPFEFDQALKGDTQHTNLTKDITFNPKMVFLSAGQSKVLRVSITPPLKAHPGTYWANIAISMLPARKNPLRNEKLQSDHISSKTAPLLEEVVSIYADKGQGYASAATLSCTLIHPGLVKLHIVNPTPWRFDPQVRVLSSAKHHVLFTGHPIPLMPESAGNRYLQWRPASLNPIQLQWHLPHSHLKHTLSCLPKKKSSD